MATIGVIFGAIHIMKWIKLLLFAFPYFSFGQEIVKHFNLEITLETSEIKIISDRIVSNPKSTDYLKSHAYFQKGWLKRKEGNSIGAIRFFLEARKFLERSSTVDHKLEYAIWNDAAVILRQFYLYDGSEVFYKEALKQTRLLERRDLELRVLYNMGRSQSYTDPKRAVKTYFQALDLAIELNEVEGRQDMAQVKFTQLYNRLGLLMLDSEIYEKAEEYFLLAMSYAPTDKLLSFSLHNNSQVYFHRKQYDKQEEFLKKSLKLKEGKSRFLSLQDLGECLILQNRKGEAREILLQAEQYANDQKLTSDNIKVYKWLQLISKDQDEEHKYLQAYADLSDELLRIQTGIRKTKDKALMEVTINAYNLELENTEKVKEFWWLFSALVVIGVVLLSTIGVIVHLTRKAKNNKSTLLAMLNKQTTYS